MAHLRIVEGGDAKYGFAHASLERLIGSAFDHIAISMVDAFVHRATQVYGE